MHLGSRTKCSAGSGVFALNVVDFVRQAMWSGFIDMRDAMSVAGPLKIRTGRLFVARQFRLVIFVTRREKLNQFPKAAMASVLQRELEPLFLYEEQMRKTAWHVTYSWRLILCSSRNTDSRQYVAYVLFGSNKRKKLTFWSRNFTFKF